MRIRPTPVEWRPADGRPILSLADLEAHDPTASPGVRERRFLCPLDGCAGRSRDASHRTLSLNTATGAWTCYRCGNAGKLRDCWETRRDRADRALRRAFGLPASAPTPATPTPEKAAPAPPERPTWDWRALWDGTADLTGTPGQAYLEGRGIPLAAAAAAGVRFAASWAGHPAVVFPVADRAGAVQAAQGRYLRDDVKPTKRTGGPSKLGVFTTPGALEASTIVVVEAPIDALSLHVAGVPAVALLGTNATDWLAAAVAFKRVALALDADAAGEGKIDRLAAQLGAFGATIERWRPTAKDWNDVLRQHGAAALRAALTGTAAAAPAAHEPPLDPPADDVDGLLDGQSEEPPAAGADELGSFLDEDADDEPDEEPAPEPLLEAVSDVLVERVLTVFPAVGWRTVDDVAHELAVTKLAALVAVRALAAAGTIERSPRVRGGTGLWRRPAEVAGEEAHHG